MTGNVRVCLYFTFRKMSTPSTAFKTLFLLFLLWTGMPCFAQNVQPAYQTISTAQGLSQGMVFDILQDQEGFIWVATKNGLNRYDGYSFKVFSTDPYDPKSLSSNTVLKLFEDSKGRIWVGKQDAGLSVYDKRSGKFVRIANQVSDPASLSGNNIRLMDELSDGRMLVAADGAGLNIVDLPTTPEAKPHITRLALPQDVIVFGLGKDKDQQMWVGGMDRSVYRFDPARNSFIKLENGQLLHTGIRTRDGSVVINRNVYLSDGNKMPFVDGFELCRRLRKDERTSHIPIIMLTAKADLASKIEGLEQGADVYLEKPFQQEELQVRIKKLLELRQTLQAYYLKKAGIGVTAIESETVVPIILPQEIKQEDAFVIKVRKAIESSLTSTDFTVEQLCKLIFMSHSQLHRKLDALTGYSPNRFIRIVRLNKAKELLKGTTDSIASIALDCGYSDPGYFARVFKQDTGSSPQDWRMENVASMK
jgi:AraC-like DNA-binding protein/CheY-like chemotaxis protein